MEFVPFSEEMTFRSLNTAVMEHVVPAWGEPGGRHEPSHHCGHIQQQGRPIVGLRIDADGNVVKLE